MIKSKVDVWLCLLACLHVKNLFFQEEKLLSKNFLSWRITGNICLWADSEVLNLRLETFSCAFVSNLAVLKVCFSLRWLIKVHFFGQVILSANSIRLSLCCKIVATSCFKLCICWPFEKHVLWYYLRSTTVQNLHNSAANGYYANFQHFAKEDLRCFQLYNWELTSFYALSGVGSRLACYFWVNNSLFNRIFNQRTFTFIGNWLMVTEFYYVFGKSTNLIWMVIEDFDEISWKFYMLNDLAKIFEYFLNIFKFLEGFSQSFFKRITKIFRNNGIRSYFPCIWWDLWDYLSRGNPM